VAPLATATPTPAPANQPPVIQDFTATPGLILTDGTGCPAYSRTVTLSAVAMDDIGIDSVVAQWSLGLLSGETTLLAAGGGSYSGAIGPVTQVGTMSIDLIVRDTSGVAALSGPRTVNVQNCIEYRQAAVDLWARTALSILVQAQEWTPATPPQFSVRV
jgi:hypothetical protein